MIDKIKKIVPDVPVEVNLDGAPCPLCLYFRSGERNNHLAGADRLAGDQLKFQPRDDLCGDDVDFSHPCTPRGLDQSLIDL